MWLANNILRSIPCKEKKDPSAGIREYEILSPLLVKPQVLADGFYLSGTWLELL